jgi:hypothetical protein
VVEGLRSSEEVEKAPFTLLRRLLLWASLAPCVATSGCWAAGEGAVRTAAARGPSAGVISTVAARGRSAGGGPLAFATEVDVAPASGGWTPAVDDAVIMAWMMASDRFAFFNAMMSSVSIW